MRIKKIILSFGITLLLSSCACKKTISDTQQIPDGAVISIDKMNVVYRHINNRLTICIPGISQENISVTGDGLCKVNGNKYIIKPQSGNSVTLNITGKMNNGNVITDKKVLRIKDIGYAATTIRGRYGKISMTKKDILSLTLGAVFPDMICSPEVKVTSFKINVPNKLSITVIGNKLNAEAKKVINEAKKGDEINIFGLGPGVLNNYPKKISKILGMTIKVIEE